MTAREEIVIAENVQANCWRCWAAPNSSADPDNVGTSRTTSSSRSRRRRRTHTRNNEETLRLKQRRNSSSYTALRRTRLLRRPISWLQLVLCCNLLLTTTVITVVALSFSTETTTNSRIERGSNYILLKHQQQQEQQQQGDQTSASRMASQTLRPLVVVPGFAQTLQAYEHHLPSLSAGDSRQQRKKKRDVLLYQPLGVGRTASTSAGEDVSLPAQARRLVQTVDDLFFSDTDGDNTCSKSFDLAGFSMGGRIGLCAACLFPDRISKLHLTGVAHRPSEHARIHFRTWKHQLATVAATKAGNANRGAPTAKNMEAFAWSALLATYSPSFLLSQTPERLQSWVEALSKSHTPEGLHALLEQTHDDEDWSVAAMARRVADAAADETRASVLTNVGFCVGGEDRMSPVETVRDLASALASVSANDSSGDCGLSSHDIFRDVTVLEGCGHAAPMEAPRLWRQVLVRCFDDDD